MGCVTFGSPCIKQHRYHSKFGWVCCKNVFFRDSTVSSILHQPYEIILNRLNKKQKYFLTIPATNRLAHKSRSRQDEIPIRYYGTAAVNGS
jgi:hypothetical protein